MSLVFLAPGLIPVQFLLPFPKVVASPMFYSQWKSLVFLVPGLNLMFSNLLYACRYISESAPELYVFRLWISLVFSCAPKPERFKAMNIINFPRMFTTNPVDCEYN